MNTIQDHWNSYAKLSVPAGVSKEIYEETRRAFYAGAQAMMGILAFMGEDEVSEEAAVQILAGLETELRVFVNDIITSNNQQEA